MLQYVEASLEAMSVLLCVVNLLLTRKLMQRLHSMEIQRQQQTRDSDVETEIDLSKRLIALQQARFSPMGRSQQRVRK